MSVTSRKHNNRLQSCDTRQFSNTLPACLSAAGLFARDGQTVIGFKDASSSVVHYVTSAYMHTDNDSGDDDAQTHTEHKHHITFAAS